MMVGYVLPFPNQVLFLRAWYEKGIRDCSRIAGLVCVAIGLDYMLKYVYAFFYLGIYIVARSEYYATSFSDYFTETGMCYRNIIDRDVPPARSLARGLPLYCNSEGASVSREKRGQLKPRARKLF